MSSHIHINWACGQYFAYTFVHEKALCKMGAAIAHNRPKDIRVTTLEQNLTYFNRNPKEFLCRFVTMLATLIRYNIPESCEVSKHWVKPCESAPKRSKTKQLTGKVMIRVFWDTHGVICIGYLEKGRTITGAYYVALLDRWVNKIRKKGHTWKIKKFFFMMRMHHLTHETLHSQKSIIWKA